MMMRTIKHIALYPIAILLPIVCMLATACQSSFEEESPAVGASAGQPVSLRIMVGDNITTRAVPIPTDNDEEGSIDENHIDIANNDFRILFFDTENRYISMFDPQNVTIEPVTSNERIYNMYGTLADALPINFKIVVLANWGTDNYPDGSTAGATTLENICESIYDYTAGFEPSADNNRTQVIPMYGVKTCTGISFTPDLLSHLGSIDMLRAMAKVEIVCEDESIAITQATLNCVNSCGYCAPNNMYDKTENVLSLHIPEKAIASSYTKNYTGNANKATFYIPEYQNLDNKANITLSFRTTAEEIRTGTIFFKDYSSNTDKPFDIARNYLYRFTVQFKTSLIIQYTVCPWGRYDINIPSFD